MRILFKDLDGSELWVQKLETMLVLKLQFVFLNIFSCMFQIYDVYMIILDSEDLWLDIRMNETQFVQFLNSIYHLNEYLLNTQLVSDFCLLVLF